jgi:hypothetical protein
MRTTTESKSDQHTVMFKSPNQDKQSVVLDLPIHSIPAIVIAVDNLPLKLRKETPRKTLMHTST